ncbi:MAG: WD40/YVTN/BNR-like repeat-containing protein [Paludibacteraceae bacterium]
MKTLFLISLALSTGLSMINAQWTTQINPLGHGESAMLGKVQFVTATEGWIDAEGGSLLHTTDGGTNWSLVTPFPSDIVTSLADPAFGMHFVSASTGFVMKTKIDNSQPAGAMIYYTTNGGATWSKSTVSGNSGDVGAQLQFIDSKNGWATTGNILTRTGKLSKTTDGGVTWATVNQSPGTDEVTLIYFTDMNTGWMTTINDSPAEFKIYKTTDGGVNFNVQYSDNNSNDPDTTTSCGAMQFIDANNGWVVGPKNRILKTTNGGTTWTAITNAPVSGRNYQKALFVLDANNIWIGQSDPTMATDNHFVIATHDGGATWTNVLTTGGDYSDVFSIFFRDINNGWVIADWGKIFAYKSTSGVFNPQGSNIRITTEAENIVVSNAGEGETVNLLSLDGKILKTATILNSKTEIKCPGSGAYIVQIGKFAAKIVL